MEEEDKDLELCNNCKHAYFDHADFADNETINQNSGSIDMEHCNICECKKFISSGEYK